MKSNVPRLRERFREATMAAILAAAEEVVGEQGMESARMEEIARRAGIAVGTLYNYFADRETLIAALREANRAEFVESLDRTLTAVHGQPFRPQLEAVLREMLAFYERHRQLFAQIFAVEKMSGKNLAPPPGILADLLARVEKLVRAGVREGVLRAEYVDYYPGVLFALLRASAMFQIHQKRPQPLTDLVDPVIDLFLNGASSRAGKRS